MNTSMPLPSAAPDDTKASPSNSGAMAHGKPLNWSSEADTLLTTLYKMSATFNIDRFKCLTASAASPIAKDSYDLSFLQSRLEKLLGPYVPGADPNANLEPGVTPPNYLHRTWLKLDVQDSRVTHLCCIECNTTSPAIFENVKTEQLRCGYCGNMDSSHLVKVGDANSSCIKPLDLNRKETMQPIMKPRVPVKCFHKERDFKQSNNGISAEVMTAAWDLDTPSKRGANELPQNWNVVIDMTLKQWYKKSPKRFDIDGFKSDIHRAFHGAPNLCIDPGSYDLVFLHDRLDKLLGPCICHLLEEDRAHLGPDDEPSFFHREWRHFKADPLGRRFYCDLCKVSPPVICRNERSYNEYRCGSCGNPNVSRMPSDEVYFEHMNSVANGLNCILGKRKAAGRPDIALDVVYEEIRRRMRIFQQERTDKPKGKHESPQPDNQEGVGVEVQSVQAEERENV